jgi:hypothetical protein
MKAGTKLESTTCDTQVMIIRNANGATNIECGGQTMATPPVTAKTEPAADFSAGTLMGKRYVDAQSTIELLCVKAGKGSLSLDGIALTIKDAKPLPSSD